MSENRVVKMVIFIYYLLLKSYPKYKIDRDGNITHDTYVNITKIIINIKSNAHATHSS